MYMHILTKGYKVIFTTFTKGIIKYLIKYFVIAKMRLTNETNRVDKMRLTEATPKMAARYLAYLDRTLNI